MDTTPKHYFDIIQLFRLIHSINEFKSSVDQKIYLDGLSRIQFLNEWLEEKLKELKTI